MSKPRHDTWMPLYVADYLKDTQHLSVQEHGAYLLLIMHAWSNAGMLNDDDAQLARIVRVTPAAWKKLKPNVMAFWRRHSQGAPFFVHDRIERELERSRALTEKRSEAGARGAAGRWQADAKANGKRMANASDSQWQNDGPSQSHTLPSEENAREARLPVGLVDQVWELAPSPSRTRSSRKDVERTLKAAIKRGAEPGQIVAGLRAYFASPDASKDGGAYAKGVHRMIEADRWRDWLSQDRSPSRADEPINWRLRVDAWRRDRTWIVSMWGPPPGEHGCQCPPELLEAA